MLIDSPAMFLDAFGHSVSRAGKAPFRAIIDVSEEDTFSTGTTTERVLTYPSCVELAAGDVLNILGISYKVTRDVPRRIDDGEWTVVKVVPA